MTFRLLPNSPAPQVRAEAEPAPPPARWPGRALPELLLLLLVSVVALVPAVSNAVPGGARSADAPAGVFSAGRAQTFVDAFAKEPRPLGSAAHDRVRDRLVAELDKLGLRPRVLRGLGTDTTSGAALAAPTQDVRATLKGTHPTGRVLLVAHYDSVEIGPGATDDGHGVASLLEVARALRAGPAPRNDVTFLFTDGEELGKVGAQQYTASGAAGDPGKTVVLNLESRGTSGRTLMFETGDHNGALVPALDGHVPVTTSLAHEVYRRLPNYTDFTVFRDAGFTGMNFANVGTSANYDTPQDNLANSSRASLQDLGDTVLGATRRLAATDLTTVRKGSQSTYFSWAGLLVRYPGALVTPLAVLAAALFALGLWCAVRRGAMRGRSAAVAAAAVPVPLIGAALTGWAGWQLMLLARPAYTGFVFGDPSRPGPAALGLGIVALALVWACAAVLRRRYGAVATGAAVTGWFVLLAVVTAPLVPGASYLFVWPALFGAAGLVLAARLPGTSRWRPAAASLASLPAAALLLPIATLLFPTLGLGMAFVPLLLGALFALTLPMPFAGSPLRGRPLALRALAAAATGLAVVAAGVVRDGVDPAHPAQVSLVYTLDADSGRTRWVSNGTGGHPWLGSFVDGGEEQVEDRFPPLREPARWRSGPAPARTLATPTLRVLSDRTTAGGREVRVRLGSAHGTPDQLMIYADTTSGGVRGLTVAGERLPGGHNRASGDGRWTWGFLYVDPPAGGVELTLRLTGDKPLRLRAVAEDTGFPAGTLRPARPRTVTWSSLDSGFTLVSKGFTI
ncbi:M20/M25/M40 family metallo-hydrolase [Streptomyces sp. WI03-4A]|uniref:M20/M25/M40 family metallo-hydrolase n=1 Tax=Streptomyces TaxID=1883 RepID=UPI0029A4B5B7|nr:M20/M25/M40 family metallo-hydrolase [Streptomyces sp. WI03-4A]MDX2595852.1 M20/M25/M40 family metallo-hydrolase [Streptomyces sp. WI03-4A]